MLSSYGMISETSFLSEMKNLLHNMWMRIMRMMVIRMTEKEITPISMALGREVSTCDKMNTR